MRNGWTRRRRKQMYKTARGPRVSRSVEQVSRSSKSRGHANKTKLKSLSSHRLRNLKIIARFSLYKRKLRKAWTFGHWMHEKATARLIYTYFLVNLTMRQIWTRITYCASQSYIGRLKWSYEKVWSWVRHREFAQQLFGRGEREGYQYLNLH